MSAPPTAPGYRSAASRFVTERGAALLRRLGTRLDGDAGLGVRARRTAAALIEAVVPGGQIVPAGGQATLERLDRYLRELGPEMVAGYRTLLALLDGASYARRAASFSALDVPARLALLESLRHAGYVSRHAARTLIAAVKLNHLDDPAIYAGLGCTATRQAAPEPWPRWMTERVMPAADVAGETLECDVVVIGTGAGGAVVAKELAERGVAVVMIEEGHYYGRADFNGRAADMHRLLYHDLASGLTLGNGAIFLPTGRTVGGSTTVNSGTCLRTPERIFRSWRDHHGLAAFSAEAMAPLYERVEAILGVEDAPAAHLGGVARVVARGAEALGYRHGPLRRNAPGCDGQGVCCYGCPTDAKRSTNVSYVPLALKAGAQLITAAIAQRLVIENGRATGVDAAVRGSGKTARITVRAKAVVVACGALRTPVFLLRQGLANRSGQLGRNLSIHPCVAAAALFDESLRGWAGIPQGYAIHDFEHEGILLEGGFQPLEISAIALPHIGPGFTRLIEEFDRLAMFGVMIEDSSRGRVRPGIGGRPLTTYVMNDQDVAKLKRGVEILSRVYFAAGARRVFPLVHGFDELASPADIGPLAAARLTVRDFDLSAYHPLGTARMGRDPAKSVVGDDHAAHDLPGLYIVDGSAVPSSLGVNPQLTIMALATRAAALIADRL